MIMRLHQVGRHACACGTAIVFLTIASVTQGWAAAAAVPTGFVDTRMAGSLNEPISLASIPDAPGTPSRVLFVEQRTARVRLLIGSTVTTVGTVPGVESGDTERGLLGVTVDPNFPASPYIYTHSTDNRFGNKIAISRFTLTGDLANSGTGALAFNATSRYDLIRSLPDNASNHNGGTVRFGPDGRLYVSIGDDATSCNAQSLTVLAGKILRLDVSRLPSGPGGPAPYALLIPPGNPYPTHADSGARLVWASGLRNPFRFHVDPLNGELFVADVGQDNWEEVTRFSAGGQNGGWPWREGPSSYSTCSGSQPSAMTPIAYYDHSEGIAIVSGGMYRRPASGAQRFPAEYDGSYFYIDYYSGLMRRIENKGAQWGPADVVTGQPNATDWATGMDNVSDVLLMPDGTLFYVRQSENYVALTGEIRRLGYVETTDAPGESMAGLTFAAPRPTPSHGRVTLAWSQPGAERVRLVLYDVGGRELCALEDGTTFPAGTHQREWNGTDRNGTPVGPGLYFAQLEVGGQLRRTRITLLR